jgi:hypothetical protein
MKINFNDKPQVILPIVAVIELKYRWHELYEEDLADHLPLEHLRVAALWFAKGVTIAIRRHPNGRAEVIVCPNIHFSETK